MVRLSPSKAKERRRKMALREQVHPATTRSGVIGFLGLEARIVFGRSSARVADRAEDNQEA